MLRSVSKSIGFLTRPLNTNLIIKRGARAVRKTIRTEVPRYQRNLRDLPPLTELLSDPNIASKQSLNDIRRKKLETYLEYFPTNDRKTSLIEALFSPHNDFDQLLRIIDENLPTMTSFYIGLSYEVIDDMMAAKQCDPLTIAVAPEFQRLCERALLKIRHLEADETLKLLKCLSAVGVPEDALIVQATLQMTRHLINDYNIDELATLDTVLQRFKPVMEAKTSLLIAIRRAIPLARRNLIAEKMFTTQEQLESGSTHDVDEPLR